MKPSRSEFVDLRGVRYHLRRWGPQSGPPVVLLHGWMDVSATFQFLVDAFKEEWCIVAPDWRGFGLTQWQHGPYWFPDYLADLDFLVEQLSPDRPVSLIGHSMGGNVACLYAGIRPDRVGRVVSLDGFGLARTEAAEAPVRYARWLDQLRERAAFRPYPDRAALAQRLRRQNPRLTAAQAEFLAQHLGIECPDRMIEIAGDSAHKLLYPVLYRLEEAMACWRRVKAPVLWVGAEDSFASRQFIGDEKALAARLGCFPRARLAIVQDAGHNLHHDQPERVAEIVESFLLEGVGSGTMKR